MPQRVEEKIDWLNGAIWSRETWLRDHGSTGKWPLHDVDAKRHGLEIMTDIRDDYAKSLEAAKRRAEVA